MRIMYYVFIFVFVFVSDWSRPHCLHNSTPGRQNSLPCPLPSYEEYIVISLTRDLKRVPPGCRPVAYIAQGRLDDSEVLDSPF
jgi:hypothetical protein